MKAVVAVAVVVVGTAVAGTAAVEAMEDRLKRLTKGSSSSSTRTRAMAMALTSLATIRDIPVVAVRADMVDLRVLLAAVILMLRKY
jgi:hypothetical protein